MKKILATLALVVGFAASVYAADWYEVYETTTTDSATTIRSGAAYLYKIVVSSAGANSFLAVSDSKDSLDSTNQITGINTTTAREYEFKVAISSGLTYQTYGGSPASIQFLYRSGSFMPSDRMVFESSYTATAQTATLVSAQSGQVYRVMVTSAAAAGTGIDIFNSIAGGTSDSVRIIRAAGGSYVDASYNVVVSSGITYTTTGTAGWTILYRKGILQ